MSVFSAFSESAETTLQRWAALLRSLRFTDNFGAVIIRDVEVAPNSETAVFHGLGKRPSVVLFSRPRSGAIEKGTTEDNGEFVYVYNRSALSANAFVDVVIFP
jgi:hypothetical protein